MRSSIARTWGVALAEWRSSIRNRRAMVMTLLFMAVAALVMYGTISLFSVLEREVVEALKLPITDNTGSVTMTLWKSKVFSRVIEHMTGGSLVFADIKGRHPILLAYAFFIFQVAPILTLLVSASRIADDLRSGAARYWLVRVTRTEWSLGKFIGEAMMLGVSMMAGGIVAWCVACCRLPISDGFSLLHGILDWTARAWMYAFAWLGLFCGVSHVAKSGGKATALSILAMMVIAAFPTLLNMFVPTNGAFSGFLHLDTLVPGSAIAAMWRSSPAVLFQGCIHLATLAFLYLSFGSAVLRRRDV